MSRGAHLHFSKTKDLPRPNHYVQALLGEYSAWAYDEDRALELRGQWRSRAFSVADDSPLDLEIGTGNGYHFAHYAKVHPERCLLGIELKYKPLIQSIRRAVSAGCTNAHMVRYNAALLPQLFQEGELDRVIIHFPDPWEKLRQQKHRLIQPAFMEQLYRLQKPQAFVEFKTDSRDYFDWALGVFEASPYSLEAQTFDLHQSPYAEQNFVTHFERIFLRKGQPIHYALLRKPC